MSDNRVGRPASVEASSAKLWCLTRVAPAKGSCHRRRVISKEEYEIVGAQDALQKCDPFFSIILGSPVVVRSGAAPTNLFDWPMRLASSPRRIRQRRMPQTGARVP
jgi:hypothetical protein